jgi:hypothetical protein
MVNLGSQHKCKGAHLIHCSNTAKGGGGFGIF